MDYQKSDTFTHLLVDNCTQSILEIGQAFTNQRDINLGEYALMGRFVVFVRLLNLKFSSRCFGVRVELTYLGFAHNALILPYLWYNIVQVQKGTNNDKETK